jgi:hypothetical protein
MTDIQFSEESFAHAALAGLPSVRQSLVFF